MKRTIALSVGNAPLTFFLPDTSWHSFIKKYYGPYLVPRSLRASPRIGIMQLPSGSNGELSVDRDGGQWNIKRGDFTSRSTANFLSTELNIVKDRFSLNSWLRIFLSLYGAARSQLLIHSAGYYHSGGVYLFPGRSGSGKSTITRLLGKDSALSDELVIVSSGKNNVQASSTPFWGELKKGSGSIFTGPLRGIFFLRHGAGISARRIDSGMGLRKLLPTVLFFSHDHATVSRVLALSAAFVKRLPAYELTFSLRNTRAEVINCIEHAL